MRRLFGQRLFPCHARVVLERRHRLNEAFDLRVSDYVSVGRLEGLNLVRVSVVPRVNRNRIKRPRHANAQAAVDSFEYHIDRLMTQANFVS